MTSAIIKSLVEDGYDLWNVAPHFGKRLGKGEEGSGRTVNLEGSWLAYVGGQILEG